MSSDRLAIGSLVLYKIRPARVLSVDDKLEIELEGGTTKRVRPKDITLLHPGPCASLTELTPCEGELEETWELLAGEETTLAGLAELLYGEHRPETAWAAWQLVSDGLYFEGTPEAVRARSREQVSADRTAREAKAAAERDWNEFLDRLKRRRLIPADAERLGEVERLAYGRSQMSRILQILGYQESPENAHRQLIALGHWVASFNPHPQRLELPLDSLDLAVPELVDETRADLTGLQAFAVDDEGSHDPDDAVSLDGDRIWVHVADVAALVAPDSPLDLAARSRGANLYLPERLVPMLPWTLTERLGLGLNPVSPALSFGFRLSAQCEITDIEIVPSWVRVIRLTYSQADAILHQPPFDRLLTLTRSYRERRMAAGAAAIDLPEVSVRVEGEEVVVRPLPRLASRDMITDAMLMAGEAAARYALERSIPIPFASQPAPEMAATPDTVAAMYACRRRFKPSAAKTTPAPHSSLGLATYSRSTSPLRRYLDLVTHQQLRAHLVGKPLLAPETMAERIAAVDAVSAGVRKAERLSNLHWKLVYLSRHHDWQGNGIVVEMLDQRATVLIPELAMEVKVRVPAEVTVNSQLRLAVREIDVPELTAWFRVLD